MKHLITTAIGVFLALSSFAQLNPRVGIKGGLNLMHSSARYNLTPDGTLNETGIGLGGYFGGLLEISGRNKSSKLKGQLELQYNYLTNKLDNPTGITDRLHVLNIPVSVKYFFQPHMSLILGINNNINLAGSQRVKGAASSNEFTNLKTYQPGAHVGFNYYFVKGLFLDLRYNYNFGSTFDMPEDNTYYRYGNVQLGLGYKF